jgi:hypothetical protein
MKGCIIIKILNLRGYSGCHVSASGMPVGKTSKKEPETILIRAWLAYFYPLDYTRDYTNSLQTQINS